MNKFVFLAGAVLAASLSAQAQSTIADWTFETSQPNAAGPYSPEVGAGSASSSHAGAAVYSSPAGNGSAHSFSANTWAVGDYYQYEVSTVGVMGTIYLSFDQTSSSTGPGSFQLQYSVNGSTFVNIGSTYSVLQNGLSPNASWNATTAQSAYTFTPDLSALSATLDNQATLYFRMTDAATTTPSGGTVASTGTDRMDNVYIGLAPVPEPSTFALLGLGAAGVCLLRRRK